MSIKTAERAVFAVVRHEEGWAVEHEGQIFEPSVDKESARAAAHRRARAASDTGRLCQIRVTDEPNFIR